MEEFKNIFLAPNAAITDAERHDEYVKLILRRTLMDLISSMTSENQEYMLMHEVSEKPKPEYEATEFVVNARLQKMVRCGECDFGYSGWCDRFNMFVNPNTYCAWGIALDDANKTDIHGNHDGRV